VIEREELNLNLKKKKKVGSEKSLLQNPRLLERERESGGDDVRLREMKLMR
jgi:hypothetical protein